MTDYPRANVDKLLLCLLISVPGSVSDRERSGIRSYSLHYPSVGLKPSKLLTRSLKIWSMRCQKIRSEERRRKKRKEVRKDKRAWSRLCMMMLRCCRKGRQVTKAQASPAYSESWLSPCLWDRVGSRSGAEIHHLTQTCVALTPAQPLKCPDNQSLLCVPPQETERVGPLCNWADGHQPWAEASSKHRKSLGCLSWGGIYSRPFSLPPLSPPQPECLPNRQWCTLA